MKKVVIIFFTLILVTPLFAQRDLQERLSGFVNPEEIVTLSENIPFNQAIEVLSKVSLKLTGKAIVATAGGSEPIGIEISKMPYKRVLSIITQMKGLIYEEKATVIVVKSPVTENEGLAEEVYAPVDSREVEISAIFFEANVRDAKERGINWDYLLSKAGLTIGSGLQTFSNTESATTEQTTTTSTLQIPDFTVNNQTDFDLGQFSGNATAAFRFFEDQNLGEIISRPSVTVRDKQKGRVQIGEDISIKERDFAGNLIDKFYSTGTIIEVTPFIYNEDGVDYILLQLMVEKSSGTPGQISTTIAKTTASTQILMLDNEETVIGGLFVNTETIQRRGIPFLKDLPWWVLGIKYLTGYDATTIEKKEIIISVKVDILPTLKERIAEKKKENVISSFRKNAQEEIDSAKQEYKEFKEE